MVRYGIALARRPTIDWISRRIIFSGGTSICRDTNRIVRKVNAPVSKRTVPDKMNRTFFIFSLLQTTATSHSWYQFLAITANLGCTITGPRLTKNSSFVSFSIIEAKQQEER